MERVSLKSAIFKRDFVGGFHSELGVGKDAHELHTNLRSGTSQVNIFYRVNSFWKNSLCLPIPLSIVLLGLLTVPPILLLSFFSW